MVEPSVHLKKLCVGATNIGDVIQWQVEKREAGIAISHTTRNFPKQSESLLAGGSLYWIIKGYYQVRQRIIALDTTQMMVPDKGIVQNFCTIVLDTQLWRVEQRPHRPFQGWRYLTTEDAPRDVARIDADNLAELDARMPIEMEQKLIKLGVM